MENDLVGFGLGLLDAPQGAVGTVTSGGTESVLLAVQTARDARPEVERPRMVVPSTAHAAFHKAAHYFGVEMVVVPVGADFRADVTATTAAVELAPERTVLVAASAPSYAHGVVDPVAEVAALAAARGIRCHVDACIGGWVLPYAARLGRTVPPWSFAVEGVTSVSVDLHKYGYAPKGTSLLLHRSARLRRPQFFAAADWPGYTMLNSTMQSTKSGGPLAGAWAVVRSLGDDGYLTTHPRRSRRRSTPSWSWSPRSRRCGWSRPPTRPWWRSPRTRPATRSRSATRWRRTGGTCSRRCRTRDGPPTIHLSVSAATGAHLAELGTALRASVAAAVAAGPVAVDPGVVDYIRSLDPAARSATTTSTDCSPRRASSGPDPTSGELSLPSRMAEINAMLDLAAPAMREALLIAFLDRLSRPSPA